MEIQKAPNDTAALSFVANSEAARYVFVVVAAADVMITGRRYGTFVLACWPCRGHREPLLARKRVKLENSGNIRGTEYQKFWYQNFWYLRQTETTLCCPCTTDPHCYPASALARPTKRRARAKSTSITHTSPHIISK